jgi:hypothetical protein
MRMDNPSRGCGRVAGLSQAAIPLLLAAALLSSCGKKDGSGQFFGRLYPATTLQITESGGGTLVVEGGLTDTYTVSLTSQPVADVAVTLTTDSQVSVAPTTLTFTTATWNVPQTVTVTAVDDAAVEALQHSGTVTHTLASPDTNYNGVVVALSATVIDNDHAAGVLLVESGGSTSVVEGGATDTYTVTLACPPAADVTVTLTPDAQVSVVPTTLTFTPATWYIPQTVTVTAVDDAVREYNHTGTIAHACTSAGDAAYNGLAGPTLTVLITDNDGCVISGTIQYTNRFYDYNPAAIPPTLSQTTQLLPVRLAEIEIVRSTGTVIAAGVTDSAGAYSLDVPITGATTVFLRVYARRRDSTSGIPSDVETVVMDNGTPSAVYTAASTPGSVDTTGAQTLNMTLPPASSSPFNIFDVSILGQQFLNTLTGGANPPLLTLYWSAGSTDGTYYRPATSSIYVLGSTDDTDEFDDDVILHEIGHYVTNHFSQDDSQGGPHALTGHYDIRLTWSEGWASFFSAAVRFWANTNVAPAGRYPDYYWLIDTIAADVFAFEIATPSNSVQAIGADNELAVSTVLWDIAAAPADGGSLGLGFDEIWTVVNARLPGRTEVSLEDFFDEWNGQAYASLAAILAGRTIRYLTDAREANDTSGTATGVGALPATYAAQTFFKTGLSPVGDEDWFRFNATAGQTYRILTANLGDGADTYLRLYSGTLTLLDENDDNGGYESLITFTPTVTGFYYVKVTPYAGETAGVPQVTTYGSYDLTITSP